MGKYLRKAKPPPRVTLMDVSHSTFGVRTRAKTLALQRLPKSSPSGLPSPATSASYLQLRSRRLEKPPTIVPLGESRRQKQNPRAKQNARLRGNLVTAELRRSASLEGVVNENEERRINTAVAIDDMAGKRAENSCDENHQNYDLGAKEASFGENDYGFDDKERINIMVSEQRRGIDERDNTVNRLKELVDRQSRQFERLMTIEERERFRRLRPPTFDGQATDPIYAEEWIRTMEVMFDYAKVEERGKIFCAVFHLAKDARFWWDNIKTTTNVREMLWEQFKEVFYDRYFSRTVRANKRIEFVQLRQTGSVAEYVRQFESLSRFAVNMVSSNEDKVHHFVQGLKIEIYRGAKIAGTQDVPYSIVVNKALEVEEAEHKFYKQRESTRRFFKEVQPQQKQQIGVKRPNDGKNNQGKEKRVQGLSQYPQCPKCQRYHLGECRVGSDRCYKCNEIGHFVKTCPKWNKNQMKANVAPRVFALIESNSE